MASRFRFWSFSDATCWSVCLETCESSRIEISLEIGDIYEFLWYESVEVFDESGLFLWSGHSLV